MAKAKTLIKGNYALAEAAVRAGCKFFAGYPITPQSEIVEYLSHRMEEVGGSFVQTESELSAISMTYGAASCGFRVMTSSSGPGYDLYQEGISYMAAGEIPVVIINVMRYGSGLGGITASQGDYLQVAKNGGHGDYRCVVLAPGSMQEAVDFIPLAFDISEKYRNPVIVAVDGTIGSMIEAVSFPDEIYQHNPDQPWAIQHHRVPDPVTKREHKVIANSFYRLMALKGPKQGFREYDALVRNKIATMKENEARYEAFMTDDADLILVAYGTTSRICKDAVIKARAQGLKLGLIRLQTLWPFPVEAFRKTNAKGYLAVEMCSSPQMAEDVVYALRGKAPAYAFPTGKDYPSVKEVIEEAKKALDGKLKEE